MAAPAASRTRPAAALIVSCAALFTDMLVYGLAIPVLPLLPATVAAGPAATGILFAAYAVAMIAATPVAGRLVDRTGPRQPLLAGLVGLALATALFAVGAPFALLVAARLLQGFAAGMSWVAGLSLIAATAPPETRGRYIGTAMSMVSTGVLVGPPLAGALVDALGTRAPFLLAAAVALADGLLRILLVRSSPRSTEDFAGPVAVLRVPGSPSVLAAVVVGAASLAAIEPVLPLHLVRTQQVGPLGIGGLFAVAVITGAVLSPLVGSLMGRADARVLIAAGGLLAALALAALAAATHPWHVALALAGLGASTAFLLAPATTLIGQQGMRATPPVLGAAYAAFNLAYAGGLFLGPLLSGPLTDLTGFPAAALALAVAAAVAAVAATPRLPTGRL